ncbi:MAG: (Fe-S)-binding protein [Candidatus Thiodiazotropha sp. (ex Rostrolucina anterorostrata)]|nr:(Fe-S)-binding protein [Candidatus Thiodiazotropha sp. (ex Rostrolucina anterorostrata)]
MTPEQLLNEADRCVKCGLCLPECPTYQVLSNEADSPRGRISLMQALAKGELDLSSQIETHLDRCLGCRACESACPSGVKYSSLLDASRTVITHRRKGKPFFHWLLNQLANPKRLGYLNQTYHTLQRTGLLTIIAKLPSAKLKRLLVLAKQLVGTAPTEAGLYPADLPKGRLVQLFTGCVATQVEQPLIQTSLALLRSLGYAVEIPTTQVCCGAMHRHNGFEAAAENYCMANRAQTDKSLAQTLITLASACQLELLEHQASSLPVVSLVEFLLKLPANEFPPLKPFAGRVALHTPCSTRNDHSFELLHKIPQAEIIELPDNKTCCGAAGSYMLTHPTLSITLGRAKIEQLKARQVDVLATGNTGCAIQFRQLVEEAGLPIQVMHPVELINQQREIK